MKIQSLVTVSLLLAASGLFACAAPVEEESDSVSSDIVSVPTFQRAYAIVRGIDYLPFDYEEDGCYARALYMGMELAAQGIESNEIFAIAKPGHLLGTERWRYHVAPMLRLSAGDRQMMVLDPSLSSAPLTAQSWVGLMGYRYGSATAPHIATVASSSFVSAAFLAARGYGRLDDVPSFAAMPAFKVADIQAACGVMNRYIDPDAPTTSAERSKRTKLLSRTRALIAALANRGKLAGSSTAFAPDTCASCVFLANGSASAACGGF